MNECDWTIHDCDGNIYETDCGQLHYFSDGGVEENKYKYCPYCGRLIKL